MSRPCAARRGGSLTSVSRILMADDGSDDSKKAAELAASIGNLFGASGSLVQVYPSLLEASGDTDSSRSGMVEEALEKAEAQL